MGALEQPHRRQRADDPSELGDLGQIGLPEEHTLLWIETAGQEVEGRVVGVLAPLGGVIE